MRRASDATAYWRVDRPPEFDGRTWRLPDRGAGRREDDLSSAAPGSTREPPGARHRRARAARSCRPRPNPSPPRARACAGTRTRRRSCAPTATWAGVTASRWCRRCRRSAPRSCRRRRRSTRPTRSTSSCPTTSPRSVAASRRRGHGRARRRLRAMLTLQNWFRTEFEYSLDVPQGHGNTAIEAFLRQRIGYCEQFAGTFAAMARSLGMPARVAVGFTPGLASADGTRSVLGKNAHAWPEVWFDGSAGCRSSRRPGRARRAPRRTPGCRRPRTSRSAAGTGTRGGAGTCRRPAAAAAEPRADRRPRRRSSAPTEARRRRPHASARRGTAVGASASSACSSLLAAAGAARVVRRWRRRHPRADVARQIDELWRARSVPSRRPGCASTRR